MEVRVQTEDFDVGSELNRLRQISTQIGALVCFVGLVREFNDQPLKSMYLEHYPGMTEKALASIAIQAKARWDLDASLIIHRVGALKPSEQIVMVAVASQHREDAFSACQFIMDYLKTQAPFWKKEIGLDHERWVEAKQSDDQAQQRWE
jgi:molybdopterin synthase catalytic subunit